MVSVTGLTILAASREIPTQHCINAGLHSACCRVTRVSTEVGAIEFVVNTSSNNTMLTDPGAMAYRPK